MRAILLFSTSAACLPMSSLALAQNAITGGQLHTHATFTNVGVTPSVAGDDNRNAAAALVLNVDGTGFRPAHRLSRSAQGRFVGSAFFVPSGKPFEVRVTLTDPDGVTNSVLTGSGTTRVMAIPASTGATLHVSTSGNDGSGNGSASAPLQTIAHALSLAKPADTVLVHADTYHEAIELSHGGTAAAPLTIQSAGDGQVILDGADPSLKLPSAWTNSGSGIWRAASPVTRDVAGDGVRLWRFGSLSELQDSASAGVFHDGARVHVRLPNGASPTGHPVQVSTMRTGFWLASAPYVVIRGLTIRCFGSQPYSACCHGELDSAAWRRRCSRLGDVWSLWPGVHAFKFPRIRPFLREVAPWNLAITNALRPRACERRQGMETTSGPGWCHRRPLAIAGSCSSRSANPRRRTTGSSARRCASSWAVTSRGSSMVPS